jgi:hypothetical protein
VCIYSDIIWKAYNKEKNIQIFQEKKTVYKGHNSYDDLQIQLGDTRRLKPLVNMSLVFITVYKWQQF